MVTKGIWVRSWRAGSSIPGLFVALSSAGGAIQSVMGSTPTPSYQDSITAIGDGIGEGGEVAQLVGAPAAPDRVVRVAEQEQPGCCGRHILQGNFVPLPAAVAAREFDAVQLSAGKARR